MPSHDADQISNSVDGSGVIPSQIHWLLNSRDDATEALSALATEPVSRAERKRLVRLINALQTAADDDNTAGDRRELAGRLSSREFAWLPAMPAGSTDSSHRPEAAVRGLPTTTSQMLVGVVQAIHQPPHAAFRVILIYPLIVFGFSLLVLIGLSLIVVPPFEIMFKEFGLSLPAPTRVVLAISQIIRVGPWLWLSAIALLVIAGIALFSVRAGLSHFFDARGLRRRGRISDLVAMSRLARELAELIDANTPPAEAIRLAAIRCNHGYYQQAANALAVAARRDLASLGEAPIANRFPANFILALTGGANLAGRPNVPLLLTLADLYDERAAARVQGGATVLGIVTVFTVVCFVGFTALSLFMPLVNLITGLS